MGYVNGIPGWVDLMTTDVDGCKDFYGGLFGWTADDMPTPMGPPYTMFRLDGRTVAGMGPIPSGQPMPPVWSTYVLVADLDGAVGATVGAGGAVVMPAMDVMDQGRMAMVSDPSGAVIGIWQPQVHEGAEVFNTAGALAWNELQSRDLDSAKPFYEAVFGWRWVDGPENSGYFMAELAAKPGDDKSVAGAMATPPGVPDAVPSFWMVYFGVADVPAALAKAGELGGTTLFEPMSMGGMTFAGITDPAGASFAVVSNAAMT
jgi:hypothetical protein